MAADEYWVSLEPIDIRVIDDVAIVHFYGTWNGLEEGNRVSHERKRTEVFRNVSGRWMLVAGHSQPSANQARR